MGVHFLLHMEFTLTERQQEILEYIRSYQMEQGYSPLIEEIRDQFQLASVNGVIKHLKALEKKGVLVRSSKARGIELLEGVREQKESVPFFSIPLLGAIPAGNPTALEQYAERYIPIERGLRPANARLFALRVRGESMKDAGILDGDTVIVEQREPKVFDIVVALVDQETTLKRLVKEGGKFFLRAENSLFPDIHPAHELTIQGVVVSLMRHYDAR